MPPSPSGPNYAGTVADGGGGGVAWSTVTSAQGAPNGTYATVLLSATTSDWLSATNFGFNLPSTAIIDGILCEFDRHSAVGAGTTLQVQVIKGGSRSGTAKTGTDVWPAVTDAWVGYGSGSDLWGTTLTPTDINSSGFGFALQAGVTHGSDTNSVESLRITVYWHTTPTRVLKMYMYKVYNNGLYLGNIPNVTSQFSFSHDINTAGSQTTIVIGNSMDTSILGVSPILDETGTAVRDENNNIITDEGTPPIVGLGTGSQLIRNGNEVIVYEVGYWNPNGTPVFKGNIQHWEATFGGSDGDQISVLVYSDGWDMNNHLVRGSPFAYTVDQSQTAEDLITTAGQSSSGWTFVGQSFVVGAGVTNLGAIRVALGAGSPQTVTVAVYNSPTLANPLGTATITVPLNGSGVVVQQFAFVPHIPVTPGNTYFFAVEPAIGSALVVYFSDGHPYPSGQMYTNNFSGGSGGTWLPSSASNDLYFQTFSSTGATVASFTNVDPSSGLVLSSLQDYQAEGGLVQFSSSTIQSTGLSISFNFNTNTIYESVGDALSASPNGFYFYVDLGTSTFYFQQANTQPDIILVKGWHIDKMTMIATIEQTINTVYFTGGTIPSSNPAQNIYTLDSNAQSNTLYGPHLDRPSNSRVTDTTSAHTIAKNEISRLKGEQYQTTVTILAHKLDATKVKPGMVLGFSGFGTFIDNLLLQIVRIDYNPDEITMTLGLLPKRVNKTIEKLVRGFVGINTVDNPTSPS